MEQEILSKLMQYLEAAEGMGAFAWQAAQRQVMVNAVQLFTGAALAVLGIVFFGWAAWSWRDDEACIVPGLVTFALLVGFVLLLMAGVGHILNPDYYAVKILLGLVPAP